MPVLLEGCYVFWGSGIIDVIKRKLESIHHFIKLERKENGIQGVWEKGDRVPGSSGSHLQS